jgi:hypothetical protein
LTKLPDEIFFKLIMHLVVALYEAMKRVTLFSYPLAEGVPSTYSDISYYLALAFSMIMVYMITQAFIMYLRISRFQSLADPLIIANWACKISYDLSTSFLATACALWN